MTECVVYWLFDENCTDVQQHGYVGISARFANRLARHRTERRFSMGFSFAILFRGSRDDCLAMEERLRPAWGIGWNKFKGGRAGAAAPKSQATRAKMSAAAKARYQNPVERELAKQYQSGRHDHRGEKNPRFGIVMSEAVKANIRNGRKGKAIGNQNWRKRLPYTPEARRKMSEASKRRWRDQTTRKEKNHAGIVLVNSK